MQHNRPPSSHSCTATAIRDGTDVLECGSKLRSLKFEMPATNTNTNSRALQGYSREPAAAPASPCTQAHYEARVVQKLAFAIVRWSPQPCQDACRAQMSQILGQSSQTKQAIVLAASCYQSLVICWRPHTGQKLSQCHINTCPARARNAARLPSRIGIYDRMRTPLHRPSRIACDKNLGASQSLQPSPVLASLKQSSNRLLNCEDCGSCKASTCCALLPAASGSPA